MTVIFPIKLYDQDYKLLNVIGIFQYIKIIYNL